VKTIEEPLFILNHYFKVNNKDKGFWIPVWCINSRIGNSKIDYQNANSPDPTYLENAQLFYRSYERDNGEFEHSYLILKNALRVSIFSANPQIDWVFVSRESKSTTDQSSNHHGYTAKKVIMYYMRTVPDDKLFVVIQFLYSFTRE
jgi:hypothetical protein